MIGLLRWVDEDLGSKNQEETIQVTPKQDVIFKCQVYGKKVIKASWYIDDVIATRSPYGKDKVQSW